MLSASSNIHQLFLLIAFVWWLKEMTPVCCNTSNNYTALCVLEYAVQVAFRGKIWAFCVIWLFTMFIHNNKFTFCTWLALNLKLFLHHWHQMELRLNNGQIPNAIFVPLNGTLFINCVIKGSLHRMDFFLLSRDCECKTSHEVYF